MNAHAGIICGTAGCVECAVKERLAKRDAAAVRKSLRTMADDALRIIGNMRHLSRLNVDAHRDLGTAIKTIEIARKHFEEEE